MKSIILTYHTLDDILMTYQRHTVDYQTNQLKPIKQKEEETRLKMGEAEMFTAQSERTEPTQVGPALFSGEAVHTMPESPAHDAAEDTSGRIRPLTQIAIIPNELLTNPEFAEWDTKLPRHAKSTTGDSRVAVYLTMAKPLRYMLWKLRHLAPDATPGGLIRKVIESEYLRNFPDEQPQ